MSCTILKKIYAKHRKGSHRYYQKERKWRMGKSVLQIIQHQVVKIYTLRNQLSILHICQCPATITFEILFEISTVSVEGLSSFVNNSRLVLIGPFAGRPFTRNTILLHLAVYNHFLFLSTNMFPYFSLPNFTFLFLFLPSLADLLFPLSYIFPFLLSGT